MTYFLIRSTLLLSFIFSIFGTLNFSIERSNLQLASFTLAAMFVLLSSILIIASGRVKGVFKLRRNWHFFLYAILFLIVHFGYFDYSFLTYIKVILYILVGISAYIVLPTLMVEDNRFLIYFIKIMSYSSLIIGLTAILSSLGVTSLASIPFSIKSASQYTFLGVNASGGILDHPLTLGTQMLLGIMGFYYLFKSKRGVVYVIAISICTVALLVSMSRGAWLSLFVAFIILFLVRYKHKLKLRLVVIVFASWFILYLIYLMALNIEWIGSILRVEHGSSNRDYLWLLGLDLINERLWVGFGLDSSKLLIEEALLDKHANIKIASGFHNTFIDFAVQSGVVVLIPYGLLYLTPIYRLLSLNTACFERDFFLCASMAILVSCIFLPYNVGGLRSASLSIAILLGISNLIIIKIDKI